MFIVSVSNNKINAKHIGIQLAILFLVVQYKRYT